MGWEMSRTRAWSTATEMGRNSKKTIRKVNQCHCLRGEKNVDLVVVGHLALGIGEGRELQSTFFQALGAGGPGTAFWLCAASVGHGNRVAGGRRRRQRLITARILDQREGMLLWRG